MHPTLSEMFHRLLHAPGQTRAARSVEWFGWLILLESPVMLLAPQHAMALLHLPPLAGQGENFFRLVGLLVGGLGMLYIISGRLNAEGFIFGSLIDRPIVPFVMLILYWRGIIPGPLALVFTIQDGASFLWTLFAWRHAESPVTAAPPLTPQGHA